MNIAEYFTHKSLFSISIVKTLIAVPEKDYDETRNVALVRIEYLGDKNAIHAFNLGFKKSQLLELRDKINEYIEFQKRYEEN